MPQPIPKEFMRLLRPYLDAKLLTFRDGAKHRCVVRGDGHKLTVPSSPSDQRALLNFRAQLRRFAGPLL